MQNTRTDSCLLIEETGEIKRIIVRTPSGVKMYNVTEAGFKDFEELLTTNK